MRTLKIFLGITILGFFIWIGMRVNIIERQNTNIDGCTPTELFVIGNKGRTTRIYDCSSLSEMTLTRN